MLIDVLRERAAAERLRDLSGTEPPPLACAINVEEVWRGARPEEEPHVRGLIAALRIVPLGVREGEMAGSWRQQFEQRGITLAQGDCLVAAAALGAGARLATGNTRDFPMPELEVEHWPVGE